MGSRKTDEEIARILGMPISDEDTPIRDSPANAYWTDRAIFHHGGLGAAIPAYSTDPATTPLLLAEIDRRGLQEQYSDALIDITHAIVGVEQYRFWNLIAATPDQHARAFIASTRLQ